MFYVKKPEIGDLIEVSRGLYQHWAVYVGDGHVIHLAPPTEQASDNTFSLMMSVTCDKAKVKKEELEKVGTDDWVVNDTLDEKYDPLSPEEIIKKAESMLGQQLPYSVITENCEHFSKNLRYDKPESSQVRDAGQVRRAVGIAALFGAVWAFCGALLLAFITLFGGAKKEREKKR
ncbi:phospholipase A and acyltransferase 3-like [Engraulis encrasicolus]|uniref:phospholipase A and acyltransferase 3-like n=1 Tax=Engraulis encrasicolus TaxID=184585 RepID=UPI002FD3CA43